MTTLGESERASFRASALARRERGRTEAFLPRVGVVSEGEIVTLVADQVLSRHRRS